jgi:hypothetical protein
MQTRDGDRSAHRFKRARFVRPLQIAPAFTAALLGALGQNLRRRKRLRHQRTGGGISAANGSGFNGIEGDLRHRGRIVREKQLQPGFVVGEQFRSNVRIVWVFGLQSAHLHESYSWHRLTSLEK